MSYLKDVIEGVLKVNIDGLRLRSLLKLRNCFLKADSCVEDRYLDVLADTGRSRDAIEARVCHQSQLHAVSFETQ